MAATWDSNVIINILRSAGAVARAEFGLICYGSNDTNFAVGVHKVFESITAVNEDTELSAQAKVAGAAFFGQSKHPPRFMVCEAVDIIAPGDLASSLDAAYAEQPFYVICLQNKDLAEIEEADDWCATNETMQFAQSDDAPFLAGAGDATDIGWVLDQAANNRTALVYRASDTDELAVALAAQFFSADPDQQTTTLAYQTATGFAADDITDTEKANILAVNASAYLTFGAVAAVYGGTVSGGDFADQTLSADWFKARARERIQQLLLDVAALNRKVPYTQSGLEQIGAEIAAQQEQGEQIGHFIPGDSTLIVPTLASIPPATRAGRGATIEGSSVLAGAIQTVTVNFSILDA